MAGIPESIALFLKGKRIAVAGVSREKGHVGNIIYRKLIASGYEAFPINPNASEVEGTRCYPNVGSISGKLDGVVITTHPDVSVEIVRQCGEHGVPQVWLHRSFGKGSVSENAIRESKALGIKCIAGGCPMMYCEPVDFGHRCIRWLLRLAKTG
jgi:hypothetical protein